MAHTVYAMWTVGTSSSAISFPRPQLLSCCANMPNIKLLSDFKPNIKLLSDFKTSRLVSTSDPIYSSSTKDEAGPHSEHTPVFGSDLSLTEYV